jgi:hypothetical protein
LDQYLVLGWLASVLVAFLLGRHFGAEFAIREFEKRGDRLEAEPGDLTYDLWELVNGTQMFPGRRRQFHRTLDILRKKMPMQNPERGS